MDYSELLLANYEYCYLESMHHYIENNPIDTIVTGLSYGISGFQFEYPSNKVINLAMHSQDIFYDVMHILRSIENDNCNIKNCIMTMGYYSLFYDLSYSSSKYKCGLTYYPLFNNMHHYNMEGYDVSNLKVKEFVDAYHHFFEKHGGFYGDIIMRDFTSVEVTRLGGWNNLSKDDRLELAKNLCEKHNKHIKHFKTLEENLNLLFKIWRILEMKHINIFFIIMPFSEEYLSYIDPEYKRIIHEVLNSTPYTINYIDFNDCNCFDVNDFLDSDHLNDSGASKATELFMELIKK